jgi:succinoglycan biosynthesis protein ExoM
VVDNAADGSAQAVCDALRPRLPCTLGLVEEGRRGIPFARNRGLAAALADGADLVAFVDDDDRPRPDWLRRLVARQATNGADIVFGRWQPAPELAVPPGRAGDKLLRKLAKPDGFVDRFGLPQDASTNNVLIARRVIEAMAAGGGLFSPDFAFSGGSDHDFFIRCRRHGFRLERCPESVVDGFWDEGRLSVAGFLRRAYNLGAKQAMLEARHLTPSEIRRARRRTWRKTPRACLKVLLRLVGPSADRAALAEACDLATLLGRIGTHLGLSHRYYR